MTGPAFYFDQLSQSRDGEALSCRCAVTADMPFFAGHFPGRPIMPAAAQIEMLQALLTQHADWNAIIAGGTALKFSGRIQPGDTLRIQLQRTPCGAIRFSVASNNAVVSKGMLQLAGDVLG